MVGSIDLKQKGSASVGYWVYYVTLTFDLTHDLGCFKVKFWNSCISGIVALIDVKWKGSKLKGYWADYMTLPFDHTHNLDLGVSRSEFEIALSQEWDGRLTWNEKDVSHPFMTMILTSVTMVGWEDVSDSDWGDFRCRHAIDISSFEQNRAFPDCNSSLNLPIALKWCTKLDVVWKRCSIVFLGHPLNFKVTWDKKTNEFWPELIISRL